LKLVITGLDPVIHVVRRAEPVGGEGVDGRIKSGHDDWRCSNMSHRPASIAANREPDSRGFDPAIHGPAIPARSCCGCPE